MLKKVILLLLIVLLSLSIIYRDILSYGIAQGIGQAKILYNSVPIEDVLSSKEMEDSLKTKIRFIQEIKAFAEDELGLNKTSNYSTFYNQNGKPILWVVTASPEFEIKAYQWQFPIAGSFSYKGFFNYKEALKESDSLKAKGYDTAIDEVNAWSTLGWFKDPILSSMLERTRASLTDLIIHELTHATIYLKDSVALNENLASFIAQKGTELYYKDRTDLKEEYILYKRKEMERNKRRYRMKSHIQNLNQLYQSFDENTKYKTKLEFKTQLMEFIKMDMLQMQYPGKEEIIKEKMESFKINNAFFSGFNTYRSKENNFETELKQKFNGNLKAFIQYYKEKN
jgi:predicted aminopeptidase